MDDFPLLKLNPVRKTKQF